MKKLFFILILILGIIALVTAADFTPTGNINLRDYYNITNVPYYNGTTINITGLYYGNGSQLTGVLTSINGGNLNANSSNYWDGLNVPTDLNNKLTLLKANITDFPTLLSQFSDDLGNRGYTNLFNFTNGPGYYNITDFDINDYTLLSVLNNGSYFNPDLSSYITQSILNNGTYFLTSNWNATNTSYYLASNPSGFWNNTYATFNKTYADSLYQAINDGTFTGIVSAPQFNGALNWTFLQNYPVSCPANTFVTQINDSITCTAISNIYLLNTGDTATGNYTFDTSTFHIDSTRDRIGINTTNPQNTLNVIGDGNFTGTLYALGRNLTIGYDFATNSTFATITYVDAQNTSQTNYINLQNSSLVNYIGIQNSSLVNYVGIQNTSVVNFISNTFNTTRNNYVALQNSSLVNYIGIQNTSLVNYITLQNNSINNWANAAFLLDSGDTATGDYTFDTNTLFIDSTNDRVGIGTTEPRSRFSIVGGSLASTGNSLALEMASALSTGRLLTSGSGQIASIHTYYDTSATELSAGSTNGYVSGITVAARSFAGSPSDSVALWTSSAQRLTVDSSGNVGIGTTSPTNLLTINGTGLFQLLPNSTAVTCNGANAGSIYYNNVTFTHYGCNSTDWRALY